jgi:hypothetical protein
MLRASIETQGERADLRCVVGESDSASNAIPAAAALIALVEATVCAETEVITQARDRLRSEIGSEGLVDAAAIIGNFERMVRIADATGIPLDTAVNVATESIRSELGIDRYASAANTRPVELWQRVVGRALEPVVTRGLRWLGRRARSKRHRTPSD